MKKALITGITGQDGSYLAELLLDKGYAVHGIVRREALEDPQHRFVNINHIKDKIELHVGSITDHLSIYKIIKNVLPDECYHLAASSFVNYSLEDELLIMNSNFNSIYYLLSVVNELKPDCKFFFAGSSELFGEPSACPQNEQTAFNPKSMYGISKASSFFLVKNYRERENLYACTGLLYNHESPRRGYQFVTRKITSTVARIKLGLTQHLDLGNLDAQRDWGYAPDYVKAMWLMLQQEKPQDYVISTGILHSVRDFLEIAFSYVDLDYQSYTKVNPNFYRQSEKVPLCGDSSKIRNNLGWQVSKSLEEIIPEMIENDIQLLEKIT